jgi:adenylate cyclase
MERRLAAILAADVVGFSRLIEHNEAGTLAALRDRRKSILVPLVALHKGRIVKLMGDGVLVEFASAVNAVECAVALQEKMAEANIGLKDERAIILRIGINLGDVAVEGEDLFGEGVNIAARLEGIAEPGAICISGTVYDQVKSKMVLSFEDLGRQQLKNISEPMRAYLIRCKPSQYERGPSEPSPLPSKTSIAILPFQNLSGDPEQEYFSDGITEDIITDLSKISSLHVIARNTVFTYKGKPQKVQQVAQELGVRFVLEGSVRKSGSRVRVTSQLINASDGGHLWADRYDRDLTDIFAIQDEITHAIIEVEGEATTRRTKIP